MSVGLKRGTVAIEPHKVEWEISAQKTISILKEVSSIDPNTLKDNAVLANEYESILAEIGKEARS